MSLSWLLKFGLMAGLMCYSTYFFYCLFTCIVLHLYCKCWMSKLYVYLNYSTVNQWVLSDTFLLGSFLRGIFKTPLVKFWRTIVILTKNNGSQQNIEQNCGQCSSHLWVYVDTYSLPITLPIDKHLYYVSFYIQIKHRYHMYSNN